MRWLARPFVLIVVAASLLAATARGEELSKADRIFLKTGLVVHALCFPDQALHPATLTGCGFSGVTWPGKSNMPQLGAPPGLPWCRWMAGDELALTAAERPYAANLLALQLRDEQNLNDDKTLAAPTNGSTRRASGSRTSSSTPTSTAAC